MESQEEQFQQKRIKLEDITYEYDTIMPIIKQETERALLTHFDPGTTQFDDVIEKDDFVDKTLLIKEIFKNHFTKILITAPHYFGKSTNMNMLRKFVEIQMDPNGNVIDDQKKKETRNYRIFQEHNLQIFEDQEFFNRYFSTYPVIYVNFTLVDGSSTYDAEKKFIFTLKETFNHHRYLLKSKELCSEDLKTLTDYYEKSSLLWNERIETGLKFLSECLYKHFNNKKVFLIIDDYDGPINNTLFNDRIKIHEINHHLAQLISHTLKDNMYIERAVLTGITCYSSIIHFGSANIQAYTFLENHQFAPYHGLTESELDHLLTKFQIDNNMQEKVKNYYGFYVSLANFKLYPLWSILFFLQKKSLENYWFDSILNGQLNLAIIHSSLNNLCNKKNITIKVYRKFEISHIEKFKSLCLEGLDDDDNEHNIKSLYLSVLLSQGYLTYSSVFTDQRKICEVRIANNEIIKSLTV